MNYIELRNQSKNYSNEDEYISAKIALCVSESVSKLNVSDDEFQSICSYVRRLYDSVSEDDKIELMVDVVVSSVYYGPDYYGLELTKDDLNNESVSDDVIECYTTVYYESFF